MLAAYEADVARHVDASLFVSEAEAALFRGQSGLGADKVRAVGNGIDTAWFDPALLLDRVGMGEGPFEVFTGQMDYRPNIDAGRWLASDIQIGNASCRESVCKIVELPVSGASTY